MNINDVYPSKYLKSADLQGRIAKLKIINIGYEQIGTDHRLVLYFQNKEKGLVLNKTNGRTIADVFGDETDNWIGAELDVFSMKVDMQGRMVDGLRVRVPPPRQNPAPQARPVNVLPNARPPQQANPQPAMTDGEDPFDDDVPF